MTVRCPMLFSLVIILVWCACSDQTSKKNSPVTSQRIIKISPASLNIKGDVTKIINSKTNKNQALIKGISDSSIIVGMNPLSGWSAKWNGGAAYLEIDLKDIYNPTLYVLKVKIPQKGGRGIYSSKQNAYCRILFDGSVLWSTKTRHFNKIDKFYYASLNDTIITTFILPKSGKHSITFTADKFTSWEIGKIEIQSLPYPEHYKGIGYSPYRDGQMPGYNNPTIEQIQEDLFQLSHTCNAIRTYGCQGINREIIRIGKNLGLKVFAGAWIDGDPNNLAKDSVEIEALISIAKELKVDALIIGSEYFLRHLNSEKAVPYLLKWIKKVKTEFRDIPIATAEIYSLILDKDNNLSLVYKPIIDELNYILVHIYPFWEGSKIEGSALSTINTYSKINSILKANYPLQNKKLFIGETGWPSSGKPRKNSEPNTKNQLNYLTEFLKLANINDVDFFYFDAYDELWKIGEPGGVGQNWGYYYTDRSSKYNFNSMLLPNSIINIINLSTINALCENSFKRYIQEDYFPVYTEWPVDIYYHWTNADHTTAYNDKTELKYFYSSGVMGDVESVELNCCDRGNVVSGEMSLKVKVSLKGKLGWGGLYWLPDSKWIGPGININEQLNINPTDSIKIVFWACGESGGEQVQFKVGGVNNGNDSVEFPKCSDWITLTKKWEKFEISLKGLNLSNVVGGFCYLTDKKHNLDKESITVFLDNIYFTPEN